MKSLRLGIRSISDKDLVALGNGVFSRMSKNPHFTGISKVRDEAKNDFETYVKSIPARNERNAINSARKNKLKKVAIEALIHLGRNVEVVAQGDGEMLESSGFPLKRARRTKGELKAVLNLNVETNGTPGMLRIICPVNEDATLFEARVSKDNATWLWFGADNTRTIEVFELPIEERLYLQVRMKNSHGYGPWSNSFMTKMASNVDAIW